MSRWDKQTIREAMRRWREAEGRAPRLRDWNPPPSQDWPSASTVQHHYGSWSAALRSARLPRAAAYRHIQRPRHDWTPDLVIDAVQRWEREHGEPPAYEDWDPAMASRRGRKERAETFYGGDWPHASVACRTLDTTWRGVLAAAGYEPRSTGGPHA